jgi:lysophospholipase L1-like esterase
MKSYCLSFLLVTLAALNSGPRAQGADYESEMLAFEAQDAANPPPSRPVLFVGSSSIRIWPHLSAAFAGLPVLNRGFGGSQMSDVLAYFDRVVARYQPSQIVIYEGDNDLAAGKSVAQVYADYSNFLARVNTQLPTASIAFLAVKPSPSRLGLLPAMQQLNALVRGLATGRHRFIDVHTPMLNGSGQPRTELFQSDMLHMNDAGYALWESIVEPVLAAAAVPAAGGTFLIDFGAAGTPVTRGPAPNDPVNYWNNVAEVGTTDGGILTNIVTIQNAPSRLGLAMLARFNGANEAGTTASTLYPVNATRDSLFGNTEVFNNLSNIFPSFKITGIDTQSVVRFTFYASRGGVTDNRETGYTVQGASAGFAALDVANNVDNTALVSDIRPTDAGEITISLAPTANNNNGNHFTYLGVLKIDVIPPQTPIVFTLEPVSQRALEFQPVTFTAAVEGAPPYLIQWKTNGVDVPGANAFSYTIDSATLDLDGLLVAVTVANLEFSATSSNAVLRVVNDFVAPKILSAESRNGDTVVLVFDEALDPPSAEDEFNYAVNDGIVLVMSAILRPDGRTVELTLDTRLTGTFTLGVINVADLSQNSIVATTLNITVPGPEAQVFLIDFGGGNTTVHGASPDDPINFWNNVTTAIGTADDGVLPNMITADNTPTTVSLAMLSRFNGANENGTMISTLYPIDATRDSLFGNTELFNNLTNIFPRFKLTGLDPAFSYNFTFYASRTGVSDNRTTGYTLTGANEGFGSLNVANNQDNTAFVEKIRPTAEGEITISLAPTAANNNPSHFTYLGVLRIQPSMEEPPSFQAPSLNGNQISVTWVGGGHLESAPTITGPWTPVEPAPASPYLDTINPEQNRFYRIVRP